MKTIPVKLIGGPEAVDGQDYDAPLLDDGEPVPEIHRLFWDNDAKETRVAVYVPNGGNYRFERVCGWAERYHKPFSPTSGG